MLWIQTWVLHQETTENRLYLLIVCLEIATCCVNIRNYESALAFCLSFYSSNISRLEAWENLPKKSLKQWEDLKRLFSLERNYGNYRNELLSNLHHPFIPLLSILTKDLQALEENLTFTPEGQVNFHKFRILYNSTIKFLKKVKKNPYPFAKNEEVYCYLSNLDQIALPPDKLKALSKQIEPKQTDSTTNSGILGKIRSTKKGPKVRRPTDIISPVLLLDPEEASLSRSQHGEANHSQQSSEHNNNNEE